jgi:hypothetical protein
LVVIQVVKKGRVEATVANTRSGTVKAKGDYVEAGQAHCTLCTGTGKTGPYC